jgi:ATP-dependent Lon protease
MSKTSGELPFDRVPSAEPDQDGIIECPLLIFDDQVILPHTIVPFAPDDDAQNQRIVTAALERHQTVISARRIPGAEPGDALQSVEHIATEIALIEIREQRGDILVAQGRQRVEIISIQLIAGQRIAQAKVSDETVINPGNLKRYRTDALHLLDEISERTQAIPDEVINYIFTIEDDSELSDTLASTIPLNSDTRQELLDEVHIDERFNHLISLMEAELQAIEVQEDVHNQVNDEIARAQREMYLREQLRVIQDELGEGDGFERELHELRQRIHAANLPEEAQKQATKEMSRLGGMSPLSPEATVIRTYLEWVLDLPWHNESTDNLNLRNAEKVLNNAHYGLDKVKERVLEHIAVRKMAGNEMRTPIICFVGPPGVGKTSLGKSIADALGREFVRVSLGGVRDEAEIRGHRRTYVGAMPGRIIQTMKRAGTCNPVFMLDEIDKMSEDYRGDPAAALLEVLDPEQNSEFADHYLEIPYDLSKVLFIATANDLYPLPEALEDRMEIIEFNAYTEEEKAEIAKQFLIPKQLKAHGLNRRGIHYTEGALLHIIRHYTLEAGVRNLEREIANVCRKLTRLAASRKKYPRRITQALVEKYLGPPYLIEPRLSREDNIGLATGLVWTASGGDTQIIEAALLPGKGTLTMTGSLGDILQESAQLALNYTRSRATDFNVPSDDFEDYDVHIHMPEGAVPKDGPSAGITLAIAVISVFTERKVRSDWAMSGEVTLRGHVLAVGGIKEKVLAARRRGIHRLILPADNEKDMQDIAKKALRDMDIRFVSHMQEVIDLVLLEPPEERQRDLNKEDEDDEEDNE